MAYDPRRHQGMTLRRRRSRHPCASSPLDRRRRRMPSFTIPSEDLISPQHISQGSRARGVIFPAFYFIMNFISPHVFKLAFAYLLLSLLGFWWVLPFFGIPFVKPFSLWIFIFYDYVRCGLRASSGPFPLSAHYMGSIRGEGTPPTNPSRHLKKERIIIPLKWLLKEDQGRRPTAASAATTAVAPSRVAAVLAAETAASPCLVRYSSACSLPAAAAAASGRRRRRRQIAAPPSLLIIPSTSPASTFFPLHRPPPLLFPFLFRQPLPATPPRPRISSSHQRFPPLLHSRLPPVHRRPLLPLPNFIRDLPLIS